MGLYLTAAHTYTQCSFRMHSGIPNRNAQCKPSYIAVVVLGYCWANIYFLPATENVSKLPLILCAKRSRNPLCPHLSFVDLLISTIQNSPCRILNNGVVNGCCSGILLHCCCIYSGRNLREEPSYSHKQVNIGCAQPLMSVYTKNSFQFKNY